MNRARGLTGAAAAVLFVAAVAVPTDMVDTPLFSREVAPTWWSWPAVLVSATLAGLLAATYVPGRVAATGVETAGPRRGGFVGGVLTFFAVGCPVCNKLVLLALGSAGAMSWFQPMQPLLQIVAVGLLAWALRQRLRTSRQCPIAPGR